MDNVPSHRNLEAKIEAQLSVTGAKILRLAPYSAPLNPIELIWNQVKAHIKRSVAESLEEITIVPSGFTQAEHRLNLMEKWSEEAFCLVMEHNVCESVRHCASHFPTVRGVQNLLG